MAGWGSTPVVGGGCGVGVVLGGEGSQIRSGEIHERVDAGCNERWGLLGT